MIDFLNSFGLHYFQKRSSMLIQHELSVVPSLLVGVSVVNLFQLLTCLHLCVCTCICVFLLVCVLVCALFSQHHSRVRRSKALEIRPQIQVSKTKARRKHLSKMLIIEDSHRRRVSGTGSSPSASRPRSRWPRRKIANAPSPSANPRPP